MVEQKVKEAICECLGVEIDSIKDNSVKLLKLGADSLDFLDLEFRLEKTFNIKLLDMIVDENMTVQNVIDVMESKVLLT